ncbi:hypothetical protein ID866_4074 [Astraeus odoratus]|nr:hypothetical protein ID866_4074 [Astraeus odoratus]
MPSTPQPNTVTPSPQRRAVSPSRNPQSPSTQQTHRGSAQPGSLHLHPITDSSPSILRGPSASRVTAATDLDSPSVSITNKGSSLLSDKDVIENIKRSSQKPHSTTKRTSADMADRASPSSESSHSFSGMADNETEAERNQQSEVSACQPEQPPKKKRTRTLTTPQQSAVLHALLAKSRFPTTAMREEVGRQIGLSARKVQPHPAQSNLPHLAPTTHSVRDPGERGATPGLATPRVPVIVATPLNGAAAALSIRQFLQDDPVTGISRADSSGSRNTGSALPPINTGVWDSRQQHHAQDHRHNRASSAGAVDAYPPTVQPFPSHTGLSPTPSQQYRHGLDTGGNGENSGSTATRSGSGVANIPAPFTLQPQPQWDPRAYAPQPRPDFSSWTRGPSITAHPRSVRQSFSSFGVYGSGAGGDGVGRGTNESSRNAHQHSYSAGASVSSTPTSISLASVGSVGREQQQGPLRAMTPISSHARTYNHATPAEMKEQ